MSKVVKIADRSMRRIQRIQEELQKKHGFKIPYMDIVDKCIEHVIVEDVFEITFDNTIEAPPADYVPNPPPLPPVVSPPSGNTPPQG